MKIGENSFSNWKIYPLSFETVHKAAPGIELCLGDSREIMEIFRGATPKGYGLADFICTDPPYGIDYVNDAGIQVANDKVAPLWCVQLMADLLKQNSAMLLFTRFDVSGDWMRAIRDAGLKDPRDHEGYVAWDKGYLTPGEVAAPFDVGEMMLIGSKGELPRRPWVDNGRFFPNDPVRVLDYVQDVDVWSVRGPRDKLSRRHPTPKPVRLMERALLNYTAEGDLVLDPFMGTSPVGVACARLNRRYIGIELEREYFEIAAENIEFELRRQSVLKRTKDWVAGET